MKNKYKNPEIVVVELESSPLMTVVSGEQGSAGVGSGSAGNETPDLSTQKRGEWGNVWK